MAGVFIAVFCTISDIFIALLLKKFIEQNGGIPATSIWKALELVCLITRPFQCYPKSFAKIK